MHIKYVAFPLFKLKFTFQKVYLLFESCFEINNVINIHFMYCILLIYLGGNFTKLKCSFKVNFAD